jgi:hypothetical protein
MTDIRSALGRGMLPLGTVPIKQADRLQAYSGGAWINTRSGAGPAGPTVQSRGAALMARRRPTGAANQLPLVVVSPSPAAPLKKTSEVGHQPGRSLGTRGG